ncbi:hypothetical protein GCM10010289_49840 [Streptomyces violascens]|uniref:Integrase n=1 Tax=Streptomyces violascens TaxID=67381 RepID=A0ABQ3QYJ2_9ACTN|nr:hypothetical protein GCM10010289_49840 [Streptomyces violascens]GHI42351.1 hypothetical protein Sviol_67590 [Streptomyces violascens]
MHEARTAYAHAYRVQHLDEQAGAWHQAKRLTEYLTAVRDHATSLPPGKKGPRSRRGSRSQTPASKSHQVCQPPAPPKPRGGDLEPFLGYWSPYGSHAY